MTDYRYHGDKKDKVGQLIRYCIECDELMSNPYVDEDEKVCINKECPKYGIKVTNWSVFEKEV